MAPPLSASAMLAAFKAEGCSPREYKSWRTHNRNHRGSWGGVNGVVIHHTAGRDSLSLCYNGTSALPGPLCHVHLAKNGAFSLLSAGRANHAGSFAQNAHDAVVNESSTHPRPSSSEPVDGNRHYYGIEVENLGNGSDPYPAIQYERTVKFATALCRAHGWSEHSAIGHKEGTTRKIDPKGPVGSASGPQFDMNTFRRDVRAALALPAGQWEYGAQAPKPTPPPTKPSTGADVPLTNDDVKKIFHTDDTIRSPHDTTDTNKFWTLASYQRETFLKAEAAGNQAVSATKEARAARDEIKAVNGAVSEVKATLAEVKAAVAQLETGGVNLDVLAAKVADELARRLES